MHTTALFHPFNLKSLHLKNRIVMAPMTRSFSPNGIPGDNVAAYYAKRAAADVGLILSEGTVINRPASSNDNNIPHFYGDESLKGWQKVIDDVHAAGGKMGPQIWHMGVVNKHHSGWLPPQPFEGPSGLRKADTIGGKEMTDADIADTIAAYGQAAADAKRLGFDCVELHGAHGYLIDQFLWEVTNLRADKYGGKTLPERNRFAIEVVKEVRKRTGEDFAVILRLSQWKQHDYTHKMAETPDEMGAWLTPLADAGVDIFHCSQRRFWEHEFDGSHLNFAGWAKKLTGKATITVGSVGLSGEFVAAFKGESSAPTPLDDLLIRLDKKEFDLVAVGRAILADHEWVSKIKNGNTEDLKGFSSDSLKHLH